MVKYHWVQNAGRSVNWSSASSWAERKLLKCKMLQGPALCPAQEKPPVMSLRKALSLQPTNDQCNDYYKVNRNFAVRTINVLSHLYTGPYDLPIRINGVYLKNWGRERGKSQEKPEKNALSLCCASGQGTTWIWNSVISERAIARSRNCNGDKRPPVQSTQVPLKAIASRACEAHAVHGARALIVPVMLCRLVLL